MKSRKRGKFKRWNNCDRDVGLTKKRQRKKKGKETILRFRRAKQGPERDKKNRLNLRAGLHKAIPRKWNRSERKRKPRKLERGSMSRCGYPGARKKF